MSPKRLGMIHVYTGEGKGKTTAAMGLALRSVGQGFNVYVIQFLKGGAYTGELISIKNFLPNEKSGITQYGKKCVKELKQYKLIGIEKGFDECKYFDYVREDIDCGGCRKCFLDDENQRKLAREAYKHALEIISFGKYDLVVFDEINNAVHYNYITVTEALELIKRKPEAMELVMTGRHAAKEIMDMANLVTEMKKVKHYFDNGVLARRGIEY
ncbi:MAG: cob(I)yrinic acid a,c-diamide adenosyltransferase [Candidatus Woesearchaeota archaeon]